MTTSDEDEPAKRPRGRQPTGKSREEIVRSAQGKSRAKKAVGGLVPVHVYVTPDTRVFFGSLRKELGVDNVGQALNAIAQGFALHDLVEILKKHK